MKYNSAVIAAVYCTFINWNNKILLRKKTKSKDVIFGCVRQWASLEKYIKQRLRKALNFFSDQQSFRNTQTRKSLWKWATIACLPIFIPLYFNLFNWVSPTSLLSPNPYFMPSLSYFTILFSFPLMHLSYSNQWPTFCSSSLIFTSPSSDRHPYKEKQQL